MSRRCELLKDKAVLVGHKVSHSNRKSKKRFLPNLQNKTLQSELLGSVKLRICTKALRTVDFFGGLDEFLIRTTSRKLSEKAVKLKRKIFNIRRRNEGEKAAA